MRLPFGLQDLGSCIVAAANLLAAATEDQKSITDPLDEAELQQLQAQYGEPPSPAIRARIKRLASSENKDLLARQKRRHTRVLRDQVDRALLDLLGLFRDVLVIQLGAPQELVNEEMRPQLEQLASRSTPVDTTRRLRAISYRRGQMAANTSLQILLEALMVELRDPSMARTA
jgi:DNA polymerase-3 subunit delta'